MSRNMIKKRIAVLTVSALTAGVFSVASAPAVNAAVVPVGGLNIATTNSDTGSFILTAAGGDTTADRSVGFVTVTSPDVGGAQVAVGTTGRYLLAGSAGTAVMLNSGSLAVSMSATAGATNAVSLVVSGGTLSNANQQLIATTSSQIVTSTSVTLTTGAAHGIVAGQVITVTGLTKSTANIASVTVASVTATTITYPVAGLTGGADSSDTTGRIAVATAFNGSSTALSRAVASTAGLAAIVRPNALATSMTISAYEGASVTAAAPSLGTLLGQWVITIATASGTGTFSPAFSFVGTTPLATTAAIASSVDVSTSSVYAGAPLFIQVIGKNAYGQALTTGTYTATSTNNAVINWGVAANATAAGSLTIASKTSSGSDQLRIDPASALTTTTTTITISHDGVPVTTRTLTFYGEVKSIVIESVKAGQVGTAIGGVLATAYATYSMRDSAGGKVNAPAALFNAVTANSTITAGAATTRLPRRSTQTAAPDQVTSAVAALIGSGADGVFAFTCGSTPGKNNANITHVNAISGATITAEVKDIGCYGPLATYTVSTDKAKYAVGEIATITILGKDAVGNPVPDMQTLTANSISVGGGALTVAVAASDVFTAGKAEYKAQMTTAGTFNVVVSLPGLTTTSATAGYSVTSGDVTNAAVLQSIVALIASINKQIAALQKLILARR